MRKLAPIAGIAFALAVVSLFWWKACSDHAAQTKAAATEKARQPQRAKGPRAPAKPATIAGKVTRKADGGGVAGAVVSLAWAELGADFGSAKRPTIVVTADDKGAWIAKDVAPGDYLVAATGKGLLPAARAKLAIASGEERTGIDFVLEAGGQPVRGAVSDMLGGPIASAQVTARKDSFSIRSDAEFVTLTAADGTYELTLPDGEYRMSASHDDYTRAGKEVEVEGKPVTADFTLIPGGVIRGQVVARDTGKPVPRAIVQAEPSHRSMQTRSITAIADDNGQFVVRGLTGGRTALDAAARGYASKQPTSVQVGIGEEVDGVVVLVDGALSISGRVVKKGTKDGIAGARVGAFSMGQGEQAEAPEPTDEHGEFEIVGVQPGSYMLYADAEGTMLEIGKPIEVVDKDVTDVIVELGTGVTLSGRVQPAAIARVTVELPGGVGITNMFEAIKVMMCRAESDATGAFSLDNVPAGAFSLVAETKDGTKGSIPIVVATVDQNGLVIPITPHASIAGRVVDTNGKPVAGMEVVAEDEDNKRRMFSISGMRDDTTSAADGTFEIVGLDAGTYEVRAYNRFDLSDRLDRDKKDTKPVKVELADGQAKSGVTITVAARDGVIRGVVIGPDKKPAPDAWVTARAEWEAIKGMPEMRGRFNWLMETEPVLTNAEGRFTIDKLKKGKYTLVAEGPRGNGRGERQHVNTGDSPTIPLLALGSLVVTVTQAGKPVAKYDLSCGGRDDDYERHVEAADGSYALDHLAPGDYKCSAIADHGSAVGTVTVPSGEAKLALAITPWASVTGIVVSVLDGKPIPGLLAVAQNSTGGKGLMDAMSGKGPKTDANGRFVIERVPVGKGAVVLMAPDNVMGTDIEMHRYEAKEGQRVDLGTIKAVPPRTGDAGTYGLTTNYEIIRGDAGVQATKLTVTAVKEGGPAATAGIVEGDKITALNGQSVKDLTPMTAHKLIRSGSVNVGQTVQVTLERGATLTMTSIKW